MFTISQSQGAFQIPYVAVDSVACPPTFVCVVAW
jgi:hypothetical protein